MATSPARRSAPPRPKDPESDLELVSETDDGSELIVKFFGEREFTISTDVNYWILLSSFDPRNMGGMVKLVQSLLVATPDDGEDVEMAAFRIGRDFDNLMGSQKGMSLERVVRIVTDLTAMAGNVQRESSNG